VATHLGKGFTVNGRVDPRVETILRALAARSGWFVPVSELLDYMRHARRAAGHDRDTLSPKEWRALQVRWARDLVWRRIAPKFGG